MNAPKYVFDKEYATQFRREVDYLYTKNICPTFVKTDNPYRVRTYKYEKTSELFNRLVEFYKMIEEEKKSRASDY